MRLLRYLDRSGASDERNKSNRQRIAHRQVHGVRQSNQRGVLLKRVPDSVQRNSEGEQMTLKQHMKFESIPQKVVERDLTELLRKYDPECQVMTANRLNRLRAGSVPMPDETRALLEWSETRLDSFRDGET